jgi:hypothetical protein
VEGVLLYSEGPVIHRLDPALLDRHKPGFADAQERLP